jgi:SET domain-containing protein
MAPSKRLSKRVPAEQPFEIRRSPIQGRGGFASRLIRKGARIAEYVGERITHEEGDRRYDDADMKRHHTFLFVVNDKILVDAGVGGNDARFINHSCDPNCEVVIEKKRIFIEAIRTIQPGDELFYDYSYDRDDAEGDDARYPCFCGAETCRGTILAAPKKKRAKKGTKGRKKGLNKTTAERRKTKVERRATGTERRAR